MSIEIIGKKLGIFERFQTDDRLPKYTVKKQKVQRQGQKYVVMEPDYVEEDGEEVSNDNEVTWNPRTMPVPVLWNNENGNNEVGNIPVKLNIFQRTWYRCFPPKPIPKLPPEETMKIVFQNAEQLQVFSAKQEIIEKMIKATEENGQTALVENLRVKQRVIAYEQALLVLGHAKCISEEALVDLARKSEKAFRLDWIKNFMRHIPEDVLVKKRALDKALIFDNYVVLHYDPDGKGNKLTQAEIAAKRDPILFGLIKGSRKLYLVGDWVDSLCSLTFEELVKEMGRVEIKDETILKDTDVVEKLC
jgi:hypothetical protein